jgi:ribonuclease E
VAANDASVADLDVVEAPAESSTPDAGTRTDDALAGDVDGNEDRGEREGGARRRRGGRERHRRDERPAEGETAPPQTDVSPDIAARIGEEAVDASAMLAQSELPLPAALPPVHEAVAAPVEVPIAVAAAVQPFTLPTDELTAIAQGAGLEWVGSDAEKIRAAQEAIAATPRPVRTPRERKPVPAVDEGPLVLVETRKDLSQVRLPFEHPQQL